MKREILLFALCVFLLQGCSKKSTEIITDQEQTTIVKEVEARVDDYFDAIKRLDLDRMLDFWADTDGFVFAGDGSLVIGYDKYAAQLKDFISKIEKVNSIAKNNSQVYVLARDAASYAMEYNWSMTI